MRLSDSTHFRSSRPDGRQTASMAAHMEYLRHLKPRLALPGDMTPEEFPLWREKVREKVRDLILLPEETAQPAPVLLGRVQRDGYAVEKWELYPNDWTAVPVLLLLPEGADPEHPVPCVLCQPGSNHSKELLAGEPLLDRPTCRVNRYPERNCMAKHFAKNGMAAIAFDNPAIAETALDTQKPEDSGETARFHMCFGLIQSGLCYAGITVANLLKGVELAKSLPMIDSGRIAVSAHSLGTYPAAFLALLSEDVRAVVFNDFICDERVRYVAVTEEDEDEMRHNTGNIHEIPGLWLWFGIQDVLAALAPKPLAINEGGAWDVRQVIRRGYALAGAEEMLQESHYPKYADPATRIWDGPMPDRGLSFEEYYDRSYVDIPDHSFRAEPSLRLLRRAFRLE